MIGEHPPPWDERCLACREREAVPDAFLCPNCLPEPEPDPQPDLQLALPLGWAA